MSTILTLTDYKAAAGVTSSEFDAQLTVLITMVNSFIEKYCDRTFGAASYTEKHEGIVDSLGRYLFSPDNLPLISVDTITLHFYGATAAIDIDTSLCDILENEGVVYYAGPIIFNSGIVIREEYRDNFYYSITYSGGEAVPPAVQLAAIHMVADNRKYFEKTVTASGTAGPGELKSLKIDDYEETYETSSDMFKLMHDKNTGLILTQSVKDLLNPFKRRSVGLS